MLLDFRCGEAIETVEQKIRRALASQAIISYGGEFVGLTETNFYTYLCNRTLGGCVRNNTPSSDSISLEKTTMERRAMIHTRVDNDGIERSVWVRKVLGTDDRIPADARYLRTGKTGFAK